MKTSQSSSNESYRITLDAELVLSIREAIAIEQEQLEVDPHGNRWLILQDELAERLQEIGDMVVWEFKQLPF